MIYKCFFDFATWKVKQKISPQTRRKQLKTFRFEWRFDQSFASVLPYELWKTNPYMQIESERILNLATVEPPFCATFFIFMKFMPKY